MTATKQPKQEAGGLFRILVGEHADYGPPDCECRACRSTPEDVRRETAKKLGLSGLVGRNHIYRARLPHDPEDYTGDLITSPYDLEMRLNQGFSRKFERVYQQAQAAAPAPYPVEKMTFAQLLAHAEEVEVDVRGLKTREEVLKALKAA